MTIADMLRQSGVLTLLGMGIVFSFLIIMIAAITLMGKFIHALGLDKDAGTPVKNSGTQTAGAGNNAGAVTAAISAAVNEYRKS